MAEMMGSTLNWDFFNYKWKNDTIRQNLDLPYVIQDADFSSLPGWHYDLILGLGNPELNHD